jgi:hypothetical protein
MFIVLSHTDEYVAHIKAAKAAEAAGDNAAAEAAYDAAHSVPHYRHCGGIYETEAEARDVADDECIVVYLFRRDEVLNGNFAVYLCDNGWELAGSVMIAVGFFASREEACAWADQSGSQGSWVFELDMARVSVAA